MQEGIKSLEKKVNEKLAEGYEIVGGVSVDKYGDISYYYQAMIKRTHCVTQSEKIAITVKKAQA